MKKADLGLLLILLCQFYHEHTQRIREYAQARISSSRSSTQLNHNGCDFINCWISMCGLPINDPAARTTSDGI